jgi:hypothetical protein
VTVGFTGDHQGVTSAFRIFAFTAYSYCVSKAHRIDNLPESLGWGFCPVRFGMIAATKCLPGVTPPWPEMPDKYPAGVVPFHLWKKAVRVEEAKTEALAYSHYCFIVSNGQRYAMFVLVPIQRRPQASGHHGAHVAFRFCYWLLY